MMEKLNKQNQMSYESNNQLKQELSLLNFKKERTTLTVQIKTNSYAVFQNKKIYYLWLVKYICYIIVRIISSII